MADQRAKREQAIRNHTAIGNEWNYFNSRNKDLERELNDRTDQMNLYHTQLKREKRTDETQNRQQMPPAVLSPVQYFYKVKDLIHSSQISDKFR